MAIKNFMLQGSYSRIERIEIGKSNKRITFWLSVYKDDTLKEIVINNMQFSVKNEVEKNQKLNPITQQIEPGDYKMDFDDNFENALKTDENILKACYIYLTKRPEFAGSGIA
jgi:hypothetical protein